MQLGYFQFLSNNLLKIVLYFLIEEIGKFLKTIILSINGLFSITSTVKSFAIKSIPFFKFSHNIDDIKTSPSISVG